MLVSCCNCSAGILSRNCCMLAGTGGGVMFKLTGDCSWCGTIPGIWGSTLLTVSGDSA